MVNLVSAFLSYLLVFAVFVVVGAAAVALGITLRKKKNMQTPTEAEAVTQKAE